MFSRFRELFRSESLLDSAYTTTLTMMEFDLKMYQAARSVLREQNGTELPFDIKRTDRKINKYEREVRRNVLTHLSIAGTQNLVPGLVLISIVIDVERIGDYTKNIVGLARSHKNKLTAGMFESDLLKLEGTIERHFPQAINVLGTQDKLLAREIMAAEDETSKQSDMIVTGLIERECKELSCSDSVCVALYARYLKRINSHLTNIVSSIVNPFPRIGFREKKDRSSDSSQA